MHTRQRTVLHLACVFQRVLGAVALVKGALAVKIDVRANEDSNNN